ncbi:MAG: pyridoxal 5'-phosphate synthase glutaminase subunit PdxT [Candidatus Altiarchaeota archaeon]|nr:pyridoxal 5'-phosphate synthase glutaminase subunit PdxT [Candidatus Altiarchaeota archaeon]
MVKVGVLSLQGDVSEHADYTRKAMGKIGLKGSVVEVKSPAALRNIDALVIPGGESTTIGKLVHLYGLDEPIRELAKKHVPILATCAGMILLSGKGCAGVERTGQKLLSLIDATVERNAFGRQRESFETELDINVLGKDKYHAVFIRAPALTETGPGVKVLARYDGMIVAAEKDNIIVLAFHPELSGDTRMHEYFLSRLVKR